MLKVRPPETATSVGVSRSVVVPSPSCPAVPLPQQYAMPVLVNPQVCSESEPVAIVVKVRPPDTAVGTLWLAVVPSPSCPKGPFPQQYAVPVLVNPHVCVLPAAIVVKVRPPETATSVGVSRLVFEPSPSRPSVLYPQQ